MIVLEVTGTILQQCSNIVLGLLLYRKRLVRHASFLRLKGWHWLASLLVAGGIAQVFSRLPTLEDLRVVGGVGIRTCELEEEIGLVL